MFKGFTHFLKTNKLLLTAAITTTTITTATATASTLTTNISSNISNTNNPFFSNNNHSNHHLTTDPDKNNNNNSDDPVNNLFFKNSYQAEEQQVNDGKTFLNKEEMINSSVENNKVNVDERKVYHIAIIGSGISGASSAYFLQEFLQKNLQNNLQNDLQNKNTPIIYFHIFERNDQLGGRLREICLQNSLQNSLQNCDNQVDNTQNCDTQNLFSLNENCCKNYYYEIGGSSIILENFYAMNFVNLFNLNLKKPHFKNINISIFDPDTNNVIFTKTDSFYNLLQSALRYEFGLPLYLLKRNILPFLTEKYFTKIYTLQKAENVTELRDAFTFEHVTEFLQKVNMKELAGLTFEEFLEGKLIQKKFIKEYCDPILRINYMQSSENISAFGGVIGMAGAVSDFRQIQEGTSALPKNCIKSLQNCKINLNTNVVNIIYLENLKKYKLETQQSTLQNLSQNNLSTLQKAQNLLQNTKLEKENFDFIILASPIEFTKNPTLKFTNIELPKEVLQKREFNKLITNIIIAKNLNFNFFKNLNENENYYITTTQPVTKNLDQNFPFNNIATINQEFNLKNLQNLIDYLSEHTHNTLQNSLQRKVDIFIDTNSLQNLSQNTNDTSNLSQNLSLQNYKIYSCYSHQEFTKEQLNTYFTEPIIIIKNIWKDGSYPLLKPNLVQHPIKLHENIYYPNAMESIISTIETSCISGKNVSLLIAKKIFGIVNN